MFLFASCSSTYFLSTINTTSPALEKNENGDFIFENDSVRLAYSFNGRNAPIKITMLNKTDKPLYIDWASSAIIIGGKAYSYLNDVVDVKLKQHGESYQLYTTRGGGVYQGVSTGSITLPRTVSFLPPGTTIDQVTIQLKGVDLQRIDESQYIDFLMVDKDDYTAKVKRVDFTPINTPFEFTSYITMYSDPNFPIALQQDFYMENVIKSKSFSPKNMTSELANRGDLFYVEKAHGGPSTMQVLVAVDALAGAIDDVSSSHRDGGCRNHR